MTCTCCLWVDLPAVLLKLCCRKFKQFSFLCQCGWLCVGFFFVVLCLLQNNLSLIWSIYFLRYKASSSVKIFLIPCSMAIPPSCFCTSCGYNPHQAVLSSLLMCGLPFWSVVPYVSCLSSTQNNVGAQGLLNKRMGKEHECRSSLLKQTDGTCQIAQSSWVWGIKSKAVN